MKLTRIHSDTMPSVHEGSPLFASKEWLSFYPYGIQSFEVLNKNEERIGSFSYFSKKKAGMTYMISPPLAPHIGLIYTMSAEKQAKRISENKKLHELIAEHLKDEDAQLIELAFPESEKDMQVYQWSDFEIRPRYTYHLDLNKESADLLADMTAERRKNILKAQKDGLRCEKTEDIDLFKSTLQNTLDKAKGGYDEVILDALLRSEELAGSRELWCSYDGDTVLSCALIMRDSDRAYYLLGGNSGKGDHQGAQAFTLWTAMESARSAGCSVFDLEGSMIPAVERFFRGFGGEMVGYFQIEKKSSLGKVAQMIKKNLSK